MKIIITGARGFIGQALTQTLAAQNEVLALTHQAFDITDQQTVHRLLAEAQPDLVINCAVLGVDVCEADPAMARAVNVAGPQFLAQACAEIDAEVMHLSTNYVFEGQRAAGLYYTIHDAALPINKYGETKLAGEIAVRAATPKSYIVRTSWVFGVGKENFFSNAARALLARKPVRASNDLWASVTYVEDLVIRIKEILAHRRYATYHVVNDDCCSHYEFALAVAQTIGLTDHERADLITAAAEAEMKRLAARPRYTPMKCLVSAQLGLSSLRPWQATLPEFLSRLGG